MVPSDLRIRGSTYLGRLIIIHRVCLHTPEIALIVGVQLTRGLGSRRACIERHGGRISLNTLRHVRGRLARSKASRLDIVQSNARWRLINSRAELLKLLAMLVIALLSACLHLVYFIFDARVQTDFVGRRLLAARIIDGLVFMACALHVLLRKVATNSTLTVKLLLKLLPDRLHVDADVLRRCLLLGLRRFDDCLFVDVVQLETLGYRVLQVRHAIVVTAATR